MQSKISIVEIAPRLKEIKSDITQIVDEVLSANRKNIEKHATVKAPSPSLATVKGLKGSSASNADPKRGTKVSDKSI